MRPLTFSSSKWRATAQAMFVVLAVALFLGLGSNAAFAQICTLSATNINFGDVDLTADTAINITTTLSVSCAGFPRGKVRVCPQIGTGTGGAAAAGDPRYLVTATVPQNRLSVGLFSNNARTAVWGSSTYGWATVPVDDVSIGNAGTGTLSMTVYARLLAGQRLTPVGTYTSTLNVIMGYAEQTNGLTCDVIGTARSANTTFSIQANVIPRCTISGSSNLLFPTTGFLTSARDATGTISAVCTPGAVYNVGLNGGLTNASDPTQRRMRNGAASITYGLYSDSARSTPWGKTIGTNTIQATGTGASQALSVYGRVPIQSVPAPGTYSDTITIEITY